MAGNTARVVVQIVSDASQASDGIKKATDKFDGFKGTMEGLAAPAAGVLAGVVAFGAGTVAAASDVEQAMGGLEAVFGDQAAAVKKWSDTSAEAVGLSKAEYGNFATVVGAQFKNLGVPMDDVAGNTDELIKLGADLAASMGGTTADAVSALGSALRGEADPAERYGLALNQTAVNAKLAAEGNADLEGAALTAAKAQAIMELATEQAGGAVGAYAREADTVAGSQATLAAQTKDAAAALGQSLLPVIQPLIAGLADMGGWIKDNASWITPLIVAVGALAAGILVINGAMAAWAAVSVVLKAATVVGTAIQWAFNAAMAANPIGLIILAVVGLIAVFVLLWNKNEAFRNFFIGMWKQISTFFTGLWKNLSSVVTDVWANIQAAVGVVANWFKSVWKSAVDIIVSVFRTLGDVASNVLDAILAPIEWIADAFDNVVAAIRSVIDWLGRIKIPDVLGSIGNLLGGGRSAAPALAGFSTFAATPTAGVGRVRAPRAAATSSTVNITVNGGLDSADTIARRVNNVLTTRSRRSGGVVIGRSTR